MFKGKILESQIEWLHVIPEHSKILILGGGAGKFLRSLSRRSISIVYVDLSQKMIEKAHGNANHLDAYFLNDNFLDIHFEERFDAVLSFYFLDVFNEKNLNAVISKIYELLKPEGQFLVADFQKGEHIIWQRIYLKAMHSFFRVFARLEATRLYPFSELLERNGFTRIRYKDYFGAFIFSSVYTRI